MLLVHHRFFGVLPLCFSFLVVVSGCDSDPIVLPEPGPDFEYVEIDWETLTELELISESNAADKEMSIEFVDSSFPIKRFRTFEDYVTTVDIVSEGARLRGTPIIIQRSLERYLLFERTLPAAELALVNHEGKLIIADTLYFLQGDSYSKRHVDGGPSQVFPLLDFDPADAMAEFLTAAMKAHQVTRVAEVWGPSKADGKSATSDGCGSPDDFEFVSIPSRSISNTYMCVHDFRYIGIKVDPEDLGFTPNAPGAIVMWNTSYRTWTNTSRGEAYTVFYKYRTINNVATLDRVGSSDIPYGMSPSTEVTVTTNRRRKWKCSNKNHYRSSSSSGTLSAGIGIDRCRGQGTRSKHTAMLTGVSGLPNKIKLD